MDMLNLSYPPDEQPEWLWPGRIPTKTITMLIGAPGAGKSTLLGWLASTVSAGRQWPDGAQSRGPGSVLIFSVDEVIGEDVKPRLESFGADQKKVFMFLGFTEGGKTSRFSLLRDADALARHLDELPDVRLLIFDPVLDFIAGQNGLPDDDIVRRLDPFLRLVEERDLAVVFSTYFKKGAAQRSALLDRVTSPKALTAVASMVWSISAEDGGSIGPRTSRFLTPLRWDLANSNATKLALSSDGDPIDSRERRRK